MQNRGLPGPLSICVSIFLEILCDEAFAPVEERLLAPFEQVVAQPEQANFATEAK